jgi:NAD(P)H-nitrite reductase large subunit
MNSLKHLGLPIVSVGAMEGDDLLRWRDGDAMRSVWLVDGRIVGCRLAGEVGGAGVYRALMLRRDDVRRYGRRLVRPDFGPGDVALPLVLPGVTIAA